MVDLMTEREREERQLKYNEACEKEINRKHGIKSGLWSQTWWKGFEVHAEDVEPEQSMIPHLGKHRRENLVASDEIPSRRERRVVGMHLTPPSN